uniref:Alternative protein FAM167A n=1 Tax=Homo sapiens TaxID=9606 RepID=L8ECM2_HUMAN|nr:alternative protein FAM167A [Homo sapiens]
MSQQQHWPNLRPSLLAHHMCTVLFAVVLIIHPSLCHPQASLGVKRKLSTDTAMRGHVLMPSGAQ